MKLRYDHMIVEAIFQLAERKGSARETIWKYLQLNFPDQVHEKKQFLNQLRRIQAETDILEQGSTSARLRLGLNFRNRYLTRLAKDEKSHLAVNHALTAKQGSSKKGASKMTKARMSKTKRGR